MESKIALAMEADIAWRTGKAGYVESSSGRKQHRWVAETLAGTLAKNVDVHHINSCRTDNRPGNLMLIEHGPHAWEVWFRGSDERRQMARRACESAKAKEQPYFRQVRALLDAQPPPVDDTSWQRTRERGFWEEGTLTKAWEF